MVHTFYRIFFFYKIVKRRKKLQTELQKLASRYCLLAYSTEEAQGKDHDNSNTGKLFRMN